MQAVRVGIGIVRPSLLLVVCGVLVGSVGCWKVPKPTPHQEARGLVYVFPGIGCGAWCMREAVRGYRDAGLDAEVRIREWDTPAVNALGHLMDHERNLEQARLYAAELRDYRKARPGATVDLIGYSAGGGFVLMVVEALPDHVRVRNVVLAQSAISPTYDLSDAVGHIDGRLVNLYCPTDWFILGVGTSVFGTVDRTKTASAGKDGFVETKAIPRSKIRDKLVQEGWSMQWLRSGHIGDHTSILGYQWNRDVVAPWLLRDKTGEDSATGRQIATGARQARGWHSTIWGGFPR